MRARLMRPRVMRQKAFQPITLVAKVRRTNEKAVGRMRATHGISNYRVTKTDVVMTEERPVIDDVTWMV